ncbi:MAG: hypothetical protein WGN25_17200 [Candidatus Electrothrix sp. GW3-4]|uniref:hypothetical protein n=1 Tax=Candidatus Electrothrix sp. GW3-4 TaxID=3126740 RepID=UPI0030CF3C08
MHSSLRFYETRQYQGEGQVFHPGQTIYAYLVLEGLGQGEQNLVIDWLDPSGAVQEQVHEQFRADRTGVFQRMFVFKLSRLGMFSRIFAGSSYSPRFLGAWTCCLFLNGRSVKEYAFTIR